MTTPRILIVDDDSSIRTLLSVVALRAGVEADVAVDGLEAREKIAARQYDVIVLDLQMPRMNGFDLIRELRGINPRPAVIVLTALPTTHHVILDPSVVHCVVRKPFDLDVIGKNLLEKRGIRSQLGQAKPFFERGNLGLNPAHLSPRILLS